MNDVPRNRPLFDGGILGAEDATFRFVAMKLKFMPRFFIYMLGFAFFGSFLYWASALFGGPFTALEVAVIGASAFALIFAAYHLLARRLQDRRDTLAALTAIISQGDLSALKALEHTLGHQHDFRPLVSALKTQWQDRQVELETVTEKQRIAELSEKKKSSLILGFCHEIPISLNSMLGALALIADSELSEKQKRFVKAAETSSEAIHRTLENVKDLLLAQEGKLQINERPFSLRQLLREVADQWSDRLESRQQTLMLMTTDDVPDALLSDSPRVRQILEQFLSNAMKYGDAGEVVLSAEQTEGSNTVAACLRLEVSNAGSYRKPGEDAFRQSEILDGGAGFNIAVGKGEFGLAVCTAVASAMGGAIGEKLDDPAETLFWLELPIKLHHWRINPAPVVDEPAEQAKLRTRGGSRPLILVAEDVFTNRIVIEEYLSEFGCDVHMVEDGQAAVAAVQEQTFDAILMDICMPKMDGIAATKAIRALGDVYSEIPMIALSANAMPEHLCEQFNAGLDAVLAKPFKQSELYQELKQSLEDENKKPAEGDGPAVISAASASVFEGPARGTDL